ncbi:hypothetical protein BDV96DRAFT_405769 [Lophiotrema nucula]|uniref:Uncharacterized protein n=1 Tax=Lophiotrema nucula TaxID=690887 RepID=A0A6A5ZEJ3_9PLEO|nr:hypothetical protein BDV96DRAFT_405769 [Lophiotrema nucula]
MSQEGMEDYRDKNSQYPAPTRNRKPTTDIGLMQRLFALPRELRDNIYHWLWYGTHISFQQHNTTIFAYYRVVDLGTTTADLPPQCIFSNTQLREEPLERFYAYARFIAGPANAVSIIASEYEVRFGKPLYDPFAHLRLAERYGCAVSSTAAARVGAEMAI